MTASLGDFEALIAARGDPDALLAAAVAPAPHLTAMPFLGGPARFDWVDVLLRWDDAVHALRLPAQPGLHPMLDRRLETLATMVPPFAGLDLDRPRLMGIVNVTPDSFSDGGAYMTPEAAIARGLRLRDEGADIIDIGGESTRPGAEPVSAAEETDRILPVVEQLVVEGVSVSIDTRHAATMRAALVAGARVVNDITALTGDPGAARLVAETGASVILMHMQGEPRSMQADPRYRWAPLDIAEWLEERVQAARAAGIPLERICVDPGIGFGKTVAHNAALLSGLGHLHGLGAAVMLAASRKSFIARLSKGEAADARLPGSLAALALGHASGVRLFRVHDVAATRQALAILEAARSQGFPPAD